MNRIVTVMTFPDALRKKPFQEINWRFFGVTLICIIVLSSLATLGNRTLNFPEPVLSEDAASYYVDLILSFEEKITPLEEVEIEGEELVVGAQTVDEEFAEEPEEMEAPMEPAVKTRQRQVAMREKRRQASGVRVAKAKETQAAALESSGLLAMLTVAAPTGGVRTSGTETEAAGGSGAFGVADLGTEFSVSADLSKDRRVTRYVKGSKEERKGQIKEAQSLEATMTRAELEAAEEAMRSDALTDARIEVGMSGPTKVEEIAQATPGRDADAIEAMIARHRAQFAYCYQSELKSNPGLKGKVVVRFTVRVNGRVTGSKVIQSTMGNAKVERCIVGIIRRFKFETVGKEKGNLTYEYPFIFSHQ